MWDGLNPFFRSIPLSLRFQEAVSHVSCFYFSFFASVLDISVFLHIFLTAELSFEVSILSYSSSNHFFLLLFVFRPFMCFEGYCFPHFVKVFLIFCTCLYRFLYFWYSFTLLGYYKNFCAPHRVCSDLLFFCIDIFVRKLALTKKCSLSVSLKLLTTKMLLPCVA